MLLLLSLQIPEFSKTKTLFSQVVNCRCLPPEKDVKKTFVDAWMDLFFLLLSLAILLTLDLFYPHFYGTIWPKFKGESTFVTYIPYKWNFVHNARKPKKIEEHSIWKLSKMSYLWTSTPILIYFFVCIAIFSNTYLNFRAKMDKISPSYGNVEFWLALDFTANFKHCVCGD